VGASRSQPQLELHEIDARHLFGDGVLDLQPGIGLQEREVGVVVHVLRVEQELEGADVVVAQGLREPDRRIADARPQRRGQARAGCDLDQLLATPLETALALSEVAHGAGAVPPRAAPLACRGRPRPPRP
jgi:hypothetical protein